MRYVYLIQFYKKITLCIWDRDQHNLYNDSVPKEENVSACHIIKNMTDTYIVNRIGWMFTISIPVVQKMMWRLWFQYDVSKSQWPLVFFYPRCVAWKLIVVVKKAYTNLETYHYSGKYKCYAQNVLWTHVLSIRKVELQHNTATYIHLWLNG